MKHNILKLILITLLVAFIVLIVTSQSVTKQMAIYKFECEMKQADACSKFLFLQAWRELNRESYFSNVNKQDMHYWVKRYVPSIKTMDDSYVAINSMIESIDEEYTRFLDPTEYEEQNIQIDSSLIGIGVTITSVNGKIYIIDVLENSPARKSHLKPNDIIVKIDDKSVSGEKLSNVAKMIRGKENTPVKITYLRNNKTFAQTLLRKKVEIKVVESKMLKHDVAYIKISTFSSQEAASETLGAISKYKNAKGFIIDLRGNPGGMLQNVVFLSDVFLRQGIIVKIIDKTSTSSITSKDIGLNEDKPMVILVNKGSASASEILSGALKDNNRAVIIGTQTYGKGKIQKIIPLSFNTGINVTIAKYLTPSGKDIDKKGIEPNIKVQMTMDDVNNNHDPQLEKAEEVIIKKITDKKVAKI